mgnify:FL=1
MIKNNYFAPNKTNNNKKTQKKPYLKRFIYLFVPFLLCLYLYTISIHIIALIAYLLFQ